MEEESWRRNHEGGIIEGEYLGGGESQETPRRHPGHSQDTQEAPQEAPRGTQRHPEAPRKHPGEAPRGTQRHPETPRGTQETSRRIRA